MMKLPNITRKIRTGKGAQNKKNEVLDEIDEIELPTESIGVPYYDADGNRQEESITPTQYKKQLERVVGQSIVSAYRSGKSEGLRKANNDDRHFKMTMISAFASILNAGLILYVMRTMGLF